MAAYQQFYQPLMDELRTPHNFTNAKAAQPQNWYAFSSGSTGITYNTQFASGDRLRVDLYIDGDNARNKIIFDYLFVRKEAIEKIIREPLEWERMDARRGCRISIVRPNTTIDNAVTQGDEMRKWLVQHLLKFKNAFGPYLKDAVQSAAQPVIGQQPVSEN
jgi:hypothetical protein